MQVRSDVIPVIFFCFSLVALGFTYGALSQRLKLFPYELINDAIAAKNSIAWKLSGRLPWYYIRSDQSEKIVSTKPDAMAPGLTMITGLTAGKDWSVKIIDAKGALIHDWHIDWFKIWPNARHLPDKHRPKEKPGKPIHGIVLMNNGDLVFNFERLGLVRLDICGRVLWRLPYRTHHSVHVDESGNIWVGGHIERTQRIAKYPNYVPPFDEFFVLQVSPKGRILREISVFDLLLNNGLKGLLYLSATKNFETPVTRDTLHPNDVETFPSSLAPGIFAPGDVMISLRNINAIIVFDPKSKAIKYQNIGQFLRQHDPDFIDGTTISVFDNNNLSPDSKGHYSRIVMLSAVDDSVEVKFTGTDHQPFFTDIMGKHQWLPNGNILITDARSGRVFEVDERDIIIWEYFNIVEPHVIGLVGDGERLAPQFDRAFFEEKGRACPARSSRPKTNGQSLAARSNNR